MRNVSRVLQHVKYSGATFSGFKSVLCVEEITVVGHRCTYKGRKPSTDRVGVIERWGPCKDVSNICAFMGTVGVLRNFIKVFAKIVSPIQKLTRSAEPWEWGAEQNEAQKLIIKAIKLCPALRSVNCDWPTPVVLAVDSSWKAVGFYIYQVDPEDSSIKYFARFNSIPFNDREARFSQPKRELYGLCRALYDCEYRLFGCRNLVIKTDAKYLKGMLTHPSMGPNVTINTWINAILMFHFTLVHKVGWTFGPDGLSRRDSQPRDPEHVNPDKGLDEPEGPLDFVNPHKGVDDPLDFEEFKHDIDTRGGYLAKIALDTSDFEEDLGRAQYEVADFADSIKQNMSTGKFRPEQERFFEQMINNSEIPEEDLGFNPDSTKEYQEDHRTKTAKLQDHRLPLIKEWLRDSSIRPKGLNNKQYLTFARQASNFFLDPDGRLYRRAINSAHKLVVDKSYRMYMLRSSHDSLGHHSFFATKDLIAKRFWLPEYKSDVSWYTKTCKLCQEIQKMLLRIPPVVTHTPSIFQVLHADTMHMMPKSVGYKYIVHRRCSSSSWAEGRPLGSENAKAIAKWLFEDIICHWGCLVEIVTDNGKPFVAALEFLQKWGIKGIGISGYNKLTNRKVE
jgi:hypothetical protein